MQARLIIFAGAPVVERRRHSRALRNTLAAIGAAVVGVIANLGVWFAVNVLFSSVEGLMPDQGSLRWEAVVVVALGLALVLLRGARTSVVRSACAGCGVLLGLAG